MLQVDCILVEVSTKLNYMHVPVLKFTVFKHREVRQGREGGGE